MPESRPRAARTAALVAGAGLLTSTISFLAVAPAKAAEPTQLGFDVMSLAAAPDGGVVAVGTDFSDERTGPLAAFVKGGTSTPIAGLPTDGGVSTVSFTQGRFVIGGWDAAGAQTWSVDPAASTLTAVALDAPGGWSSVDAAAATGDTLALAGTRNDELSGRQVVVSTDDGETATVLPGAESARDLAVDATGGTVTTYAIGTSYDPETETESGHLWVAGADGQVGDFPVSDQSSAVAESGGTVYVADDVTEGDAFGGEVRAFDAADGHLVGTVSFADAGWVRDLATSADGSTLYVTTSYSLYAVPVAGFADFDPATADVVEADGSRLGALAITETDGTVTAYTSADDTSVVALTAPEQPTFQVQVDDYDPTSVAVTLSDELARSNYRAVLSIGENTVKAAPDACDSDYGTATTTCYFRSLQRGVDYNVTVRVTNALGTSSTVHAVRTPGLIDGPSSVSFTGTPQVGATLTANVGTGWPGGTTFTYEWGYSTGEMGDLVSTSPTFKVPANLAGTYLTLVVTGHQGPDFRQVASAHVLVKAAPSHALPTLPTTAKMTPKIAGKAKVGKKISATVGAWPTGTTLHYQWYANGKAVKAATKKTLKLTKKLKGKKVSVHVTGTKPGYTPVTRASKPVKVS